jgi:glyoxylase-like metal-dependent hydrolase (beta-lactamase superfamily II)
MLRSRALVLVLASLAAPIAGASSQSAHSIVVRAVDAAGGAAALRAVRTSRVETVTASFGIGQQEETPASPARVTTFAGWQATDLVSLRHTYVLDARPGIGPGGVNRQRGVYADGRGMLEFNGVLSADGGTQLAAALRSTRLSVIRLLLSALDNPSALQAEQPRRWRGDMHDVVRYALGPDTLTMLFARSSGLLSGTETITDDPILGDRVALTHFSRWTRTGAVRLPRQVDAEVNGRLASQVFTTAQQLDVPLGDSLFAIPDSIARQGTPPLAAPPPPVVTLATLAPGVWRAEGGSHHSLVVEQSDGLVIVEAPLSSARSRAVLDTLRSRFPGRRVTIVAMTHHHWDHSGGIRGYLAARIPVAAHAGNVEFVRGIAAARKTIAPDALSRSASAPAIRAVHDSATLGSGERRVVLYELPTAHARGMLAAYVPSARLLFVSDVLSPAAIMPAAGSAEVVAMVRARGIAVDRVVGGHEGVAAYADVERAAGTMR